MKDATVPKVLSKRYLYIIFLILIAISSQTNPHTLAHADSCDYQAFMKIDVPFEAIIGNAEKATNTLRKNPSDYNTAYFYLDSFQRQYEQVHKDKEKYFSACPSARAEHEAELNKLDQIATRKLSELEDTYKAAKAKAH